MSVRNTLIAALCLPVLALAKGAAVEYKAGDLGCEGYWISPTVDGPLVLLVHDWDGLTDYEIERSKMLAAEGYSVFAVDLFGKGVRPEETSEKQRLTGELYADRAAMRERLNAGLAEAERQGANTENAVAMGYCFGGSAIMELARSGAELKGFASFHGGLELPGGQDYSQVKGSVIVFHGSADSFVPISRFADMVTGLEEAGVSHEMITYSAAPHAFSVFGSERYREVPDKKSWARFLDYLDETLGD